MRLVLAAAFALLVGTAAQAAGWRVETVPTPARVDAIETGDGSVEVNAGGLWYRLTLGDKGPSLSFHDERPNIERPEGALADGRVTMGTGDIARAWLAEPTDRYDHGILGDKLEAGAVVIVRRDGTQQTLKLKADAVFEDLEPRIVDLDGDGHDEIVLIKSSLTQGSSLAVIGLRKTRYEIVAETPPLGAPHRWLDVAGIADFTGAGSGNKQIALVRQPHGIGELQLWSYGGGRLRQLAAIPDAANHIAGTRAIDMDAVADFDGDGVADLAVPSLDRTRLRFIGFKPQPREIGSIALPAAAATDMAVLAGGARPPFALGLADGSLVVVRPAP
jgi:hypothetical protein